MTNTARKVGDMKEMSKDKRKKSMLIVHNDADAAATAHLEFINPNSMAYQNAVLEDKLNKARKAVKKAVDVQTDILGNYKPGASLRIKKY